jgi:hypothetical protein
MALEHLDKDRSSSSAAGVFTSDVIDAYMELKMQEVTRFRMSTHPIELELLTAADHVMTPRDPHSTCACGRCHDRRGRERGAGGGVHRSPLPLWLRRCGGYAV